jgi:hypothetical protein
MVEVAGEFFFHPNFLENFLGAKLYQFYTQFLNNFFYSQQRQITPLLNVHCTEEQLKLVTDELAMLKAK